MLEATVVIMAAGILVAAWAIWRRTQARPRAMKEFARDLVEHPEYYEQISEEHKQYLQALDAAKDASPRTASEFPRLIDDLLSHEKLRVNVAEIHLRKVVAEAEQQLLAALDDPRATWSRDRTHSVDTAPAERVAGLLTKIPSRALGERIGHLADHPDWHVRRFAAKARAALGRADDLPFVLDKLAQRCDDTEKGVELAIEKGWAEPAFIAGLHEWAERTALDDSLPFSLWAVKYYAEHGGPAAVEALRSPHVLSVSNNRTIHAALEQLNRRGVPIEPEVVRPLLDKSIACPKTWPWDCVFPQALQALAVSDPDAANRLAESYLDHTENPRYRWAAIDFVRESAGLPEPFAIEPPDGMDLTDTERETLAALAQCSVIFGEICNGGLSQYFFNSSGDEWPNHVRALRAIGFEQGAEAIEEASRLIHWRGASLDRNKRIAQYAALSERKEKRLDELSELFYSDAPRLRFMLRHKDLFVRVRKARQEAGLDAK